MDEASLTLYKLRVFCEVVELQSFTGAAARLHTTQPALSLHMRSLEKFFGAPLVRQEGRRTVTVSRFLRAARSRRATVSRDQQGRLRRAFQLRDQSADCRALRTSRILGAQ